MKVIIEKDELQRRLSDIQSIVEKRDTIPILSHFLLSVEKENSYIIATDAEMAIKEPITLNAVETGSICIPAKRLFEIVRELEDKIILESVDSEWVKIRSGKSSFRLACLSALNFPGWLSIEGAEEMDIVSSLLFEMINKTIYAASESTHQMFNNILFHIKTDMSGTEQTGGIAVMVGTDGHRLAISEKAIRSSFKEDKKIIISKKSMAELKKFISDGEKVINIALGGNYILFSIDGKQFSVRLIEGTYPDYEKTIPLRNEKILSVSKDALMKSLRRVSVINREKSNTVKVDINPNNIPNSMVISSLNPNIGEANEEIDVSYPGEAMTIFFNARYILEVMGVMSSERIVFKLDGPLGAALVMEDRKEDYRCVIMPMRE